MLPSGVSAWSLLSSARTFHEAPLPPRLPPASPLLVLRRFFGRAVRNRRLRCGASEAHRRARELLRGGVRPIFQANCQGCHQPSKAKGGYGITSFSKLLAGGEKDGVAIVSGDHKKGSLIEQITPVSGEAEMPKGKPPLPEHEVELVRRWNAEGAKDDTPADAKQHFDAEHPPALSPVARHQLPGLLAGRAMARGRGGRPARLGEVQIWEVAYGKLKVSAPTGWDTLYGVSWSPDSKFVAFGCADNTVRAIEAESGKQIFQMGSHNDWVLETAFSGKGDHLVSVGRDMTAKLSEVAGGRFVDNITSITPGALRGGIHALDRHPSHEVILVGGSDGVPQLFRIFRTTARKIGDNANLIQRYPEMTGRIFSTRFSKDGLKFAVGSALDGKGEVSVFGTAKTIETPADIAAIRSKDARKHPPRGGGSAQGV